MRGLLLEVRGRTLPCHVERRGGPRPPGEPVPLDPRPRVARIERSWDYLRLEALRVPAGEGRTEGRADRGSGADAEAGQGGPVYRPVCPAHLRILDRSGRRPSKRLGGPRGSLAVRQEDR